MKNLSCQAPTFSVWATDNIFLVVQLETVEEILSFVTANDHVAGMYTSVVFKLHDCLMHIQI